MTFAPFSEFNATTGALICIYYAEPQPGQVTGATVPLPADYSGQTHAWSTSARQHLPSASVAKAWLIQKVKDEAEQRKMAVLTAGGAKKAVYAQQAAEVVAYRAAPVLALLGMMLVVDRKKFRFAYWSAKKRGEPTIATAIARFEAGADPSNEDVARIEAIEQDACRAIRDASTYDAVRAAHAAINWTWAG
jgi:hypothetical protein